MPHTRPHARSQGLAKGRARTRALLWAEVPCLPHQGCQPIFHRTARSHPMGAQAPTTCCQIPHGCAQVGRVLCVWGGSKHLSPRGKWGGVSNWEKWSFRPLCPAFFSCSANIDTFRLAPVTGSCDGQMVSTWPDCGCQVFNPA